MKRVLIAGLLSTAVLSLAVNAEEVVYKLRTVAAGQLGGMVFQGAIVTITMQSDTRWVATHTEYDIFTGEEDTVYENSRGTATVTVVQGESSTTAAFLPDQIFARYDITNGIAGIGSTISPFYPFVLDCRSFVGQPCIFGNWGFDGTTVTGDGITGALATIENDPSLANYVSTPTLRLPTGLSKSTLMTGYVSVCADLNCGAATVMLHTTLGNFVIYGASSGIFTVVTDESIRE